jgi:hypothetical protein
VQEFHGVRLRFPVVLGELLVGVVVIVGATAMDASGSRCDYRRPRERKGREEFGTPDKGILRARAPAFVVIVVILQKQEF